MEEGDTTQQARSHESAISGVTDVTTNHPHFLSFDFFFEAESPYVALAVLELNTWTRSPNHRDLPPLDCWNSRCAHHA